MKLFDDSFEGIETYVFETDFADFPPDNFDGVHLRRARRQMKKRDIMRDYQISRLMVCSAVKTEQNQKVIEFQRQVFEKNIHVFRIVFVENQ